MLTLRGSAAGLKAMSCLAHLITVHLESHPDPELQQAHDVCMTRTILIQMGQVLMNTLSPFVEVGHLEFCLLTVCSLNAYQTATDDCSVMILHLQCLL